MPRKKKNNNSESCEAKRASNFSESEVEMLKSEVAAKKGILFAKLSEVMTREVITTAWKDVTAAVNEVGGQQRSVDQIRVAWQNIKSRAKKSLAGKKKVFRLTGGGEGTDDLTPDEERMLGIIGSECVEGILGGIDSAEKNVSNNGDECSSQHNNNKEDQVTFILEVPSSESSFSPPAATTTTNSTFEEIYLNRSAESSSSYSPPPTTTTTANPDAVSHSSQSRKRRRVENSEDTTLMLLEQQKAISHTLNEIQHELSSSSERIDKHISTVVEKLGQLVDIQKQRREIEQKNLEFQQTLYLLNV